MNTAVMNTAVINTEVINTEVINTEVINTAVTGTRRSMITTVFVIATVWLRHVPPIGRDHG